MACPMYPDQQVDGGPDCCDLSCCWVTEREPLLWEGSD